LDPPNTTYFIIRGQIFKYLIFGFERRRRAFNRYSINLTLPHSALQPLGILLLQINPLLSIINYCNVGARGFWVKVCQRLFDKV